MSHRPCHSINDRPTRRIVMIKKVRCFYAAACVLTAMLTIATTAAAQNGLPPLIDREIFFGNPEIASAQISPDGKYIAFRKPYKDTMNLWVKRTDEPFKRSPPAGDDFPGRRRASGRCRAAPGSSRRWRRR